MSVPYVVYAAADGTILRRGYCVEADLDKQPRAEGEKVARVDSLEGIHDVFCRYNCSAAAVEEIPGRAEGVLRLAARQQDERLARRADMRRRLSTAEGVVQFLEELVDRGYFDRA